MYAPIADIAEKVIEKDVNATEKELEEEVEKELEVEIGKKIEKKTKEEKTYVSWSPKTKLGKEVKEGKIKNIDEISIVAEKFLKRK